MKQTEFFSQVSNDLKNKIHFLHDKPEETLESTIKALWLMAAGIPVSSEKALEMTLPDLTESQADSLNQLIEQRLNNVPLAHLTQRQRFMGIELKTDKRALIPRKETEILGRKALEVSNMLTQSKGPIKVIDVCCGSGNLGLAIAHFNQQCRVYATDLSQEAVELTRDNITLLTLEERMEARQGDLLSAFETDEFYEKADLVVCNPPYILSSNVGKMDAEIASNEPVLAFDGGMLGIKIIQKLIREAPKFLTPGGWLLFEVGAGQGDFIAQICDRSALYSHIETASDHNSVIRVILAQK